jgi:hypothetical protein
MASFICPHSHIHVQQRPAADRRRQGQNQSPEKFCPASRTLRPRVNDLVFQLKLEMRVTASIDIDLRPVAT